MQAIMQSNKKINQNSKLMKHTPISYFSFFLPANLQLLVHRDRLTDVLQYYVFGTHRDRSTDVFTSLENMAYLTAAGGSVMRASSNYNICLEMLKVPSLGSSSSL